jgi:molybdopterin converting factor small subunit
MSTDTRPATIAIAVRYFGPLRDITSTHTETVGLTLPDSVAGIDRQIRAYRPGLESQTYRIAVDEVLRDPGEEVSSAREIALLPPFSGG